jgi:small multidrug resistance family-3 protein
MTVRSACFFAAAALAEIAGVFLIWRSLREGASTWEGFAGALLLAGYGVLACLQRATQFGRVLAAYGGVFVAGSLLWGVVLDGFRPRAHDLLGAGLCLIGVGVIMSGDA